MASMRNSWIPMMALAATAVIAVILVSSDYEHGRVGPAIYPGIYPTTERFVPSLDGLTVATEAVDGAPLAYREERDRRLGLEVVPWDELCIALEDHHPLTKSVAKGLAEDLTGFLARNGADGVTPADAIAPLVIILPTDEFPKLPMAVRRVLRVRTLSPAGAAFMEGAIEQPREVVVEVGQHDAVGPAVARRTGMATVGSVRERHVHIRAQVPAVDAATPWPSWHATVGRAIAARALRELHDGDPPERPWDEAADRTTAVLSRHHAFPAREELAWEEVAPDPPHSSVDRWYGVYQLPLVRGWDGAIVGTEVPVVKKGVVKPTIEVLAEVMGKGKWQEPERSDERWLWRANEDGDFGYAIADAADWGWRLSVIQRHPRQAKILEAWLAAAADGDAVSRGQLRRHLLAAGLPSEWRDRAAELLRADPDAADLALLGLRDDASERERKAAQAVAWVRGLPVSERPGSWPDGAAAGTWDGRPTLVALPEGGAVVARDAAGAVMLWWRVGERSPRYGLGEDALVAAGITLGEAGPVAAIR